MQGKNIKRNIGDKIKAWAASVSDEKVQNAILDNVIVTGGAIVSLLQGEVPRDYDVYFRNQESLKIVAEHYINKFIEKAGDEGQYNPTLQRCFWNEDERKWTVLNSSESKEDERLRIFIKSQGACGIEDESFSQSDMEYKRELAKLNERIKGSRKDQKEPQKHDPYSPVFFTNNAITLSDGVQIVIRFYGEPDEVHKNYDFVHCCSYYTSWDKNLVLPSRALEAIINKELYYIGSKYPLCSIIRTRKFINRGWNINAGQYVKMALQLNELDLKNLHVFEEQLIGVDSAYFTTLINNIEQMKKNDPNFSMDSGYLINLINDVFDEGYTPDGATSVE